MTTAVMEKGKSMKLPNDEIVHYKSNDGVNVIIERTELVRCKDCKHHEDFLSDDGDKVLCWVHDVDIVMAKNDYCSYGEKK